MKAFKNRLEEMVHYDKLGDFLLKASDDEPKKCKSVTVII